MVLKNVQFFGCDSVATVGVTAVDEGGERNATACAKNLREAILAVAKKISSDEKEVLAGIAPAIWTAITETEW